MPELPRISGDEAIAVFRALGFLEVRQRGSHVALRRGGEGCVIPRHKELASAPCVALYARPGSVSKSLLLPGENKSET